MSDPVGSARVELRQKAERAARRLSRDPRVALVFLFGSVEAPGSSPPGDLDLGVWTQPALGLDELMRLRADLVLEIQAPIDLVSLNDASVVLAYEVAESGRCLFARTPDAETEFVVRARALLGLPALPRGAVAFDGRASRGAAAWSLGGRPSANASCAWRRSSHGSRS